LATPYLDYNPSANSYETEPEFVANENISVPMTYTLASAPVSVDARGDKVVRKGTLMSLNPYNGMLQPESADTYLSGYSIIGPLLNRANLRYGNVVEAILWNGIVFEDFITDRGVFGTVPEAVKSRLGARIQFVRKSTQAQ